MSAEKKAYSWISSETWKGLRGLYADLEFFLAKANLVRKAEHRDEEQRMVRKKAAEFGGLRLRQRIVRSKHGVEPPLEKAEKNLAHKLEKELNLEIVKAKLRAFESWYQQQHFGSLSSHSASLINGSDLSQVINFFNDRETDIKAWQVLTGNTFPDWIYDEVSLKKQKG
jgi:hypothetical protein